MTEKEAWKLLKLAQENLDFIRSQIDEIFQETPDRSEALKKIISEGRADSIRQVIQKFQRACYRWVSFAKDENGISN